MSLPADSLQISEIYASIQGESSFAGLPCTFVRLTGCNLRCVWCDTAHAFHGGERLALTDVVERALGFHTQLIEVTGGEPLLQAGVFPLMSALADAGRTILLETSGSIDIAAVDPRVHRIVDLKPPDSGEQRANLWSNLQHLSERDEIKFVLASRADYEWAREVIAARGLAKGPARLLMGPVHGALDPRALVEWILADRLEVRFQLQLHKHIWPPDTQGV